MVNIGSFILINKVVNIVNFFLIWMEKNIYMDFF